jgi:hypothetical protein
MKHWLKRFIVASCFAVMVIALAGCEGVTTAAPTTAAPTTAAPTTVAPTTAVPTTLAPSTAQPTTVQPTTAAPTTLQPTTLPPTTAAPTTAQPTTEPGPQLEPIADVLQNKAPDSTVWVQGTIYYVQSNGFYLSDSALGKIFVNVPTSFTDTVGISVGKEVEVQGTYRVTSNKPYISLATLALVSETGPEVEAVPAVVSQLTGKDPASKTGSWYQFVQLTGKLELDTATDMVKIIDDAGNEISFIPAYSNDDALKAKLGVRISVNAVVSEYSTFGQVWRLVFMGTEEEIVLTPFTIVDVQDMINLWLPGQVPSEIKGSLTLPAYYDKIDDLLITWSTTIPDDIEILALESGATLYNTNISLPDQDVPGILTATIHYMEEDPYDVEFNVTVKHLTATSLETALNSGDYIVMFEAVVIGFAETQTNTQNSLILQDLTNPNVTITVDYNRIELGNYGLLSVANPSIGDVVIVAGGYRTTGRPSIINPIVTTKTGATQAPVYDFENAYAMTNQASWQSFPGFNTLVKIVNPYMRYSTSSMPGDTNWIRLGYSDTAVGTSYGPSNNKSLAFLIRPIDALMGAEWRLDLGVPTTGGEPIMYDGAIYGFFIYESDTYIQFVAVKQEHIVPSDRLKAIQDIRSAIPSRHEEGDIALPLTHDNVTGDIVWSSTNPSVIAINGDVTFPETDTVVTLSATFFVGAEEITVTRDVLVIGQIKIVLQVDDVLNDGIHGDIFNVEGVVLSGGYNTVGGLSDIFLQDKTTGSIIIVQNLMGLGVDFNIGDLIELSGSLVIDSNIDGNEYGKKFIQYDTNLVVVEANVGILDYKTNAIVVGSHEDAVLLFDKTALVFGAVYYIGGDTFYFNCTSSTYSATGSLNARFHLNPAAAGISDIRYGTKTMVINDSGSRANVGENWVEDILGINGSNYPGIGYPGFEYHGGFYAVLKNGSASYYYWTLLSVDDFEWETDSEKVARELDELIPANITGGDLDLPTTHDLVTGIITWSSNKPDVISIAGDVTYGSEDVVVTLTATYVVDGLEYTTDIVINVLALPVMSVTQVLASATDGEVVKVKGIVVGFHWNGSSTVNAATNGIILKDATGNDVLYVVGLYGEYGSTRAVYVVGEGEDAHTLALGDEIEFSATYGIATTTGHAGRKTLTIASAAAANMQIKNTEVAYTFDTASAVVIDSDEDLLAVAEGLEYGKLYKLEGAFCFRASATAYGTGVNMVPSFANAEIADFNEIVTWEVSRPQRFSFKFDGNVPNLGDAWWETMLNITSSNFGGTALDGHMYDASSYIYFYIGNALPTAAAANGYIQLVILDSEHINVTRILP